MTAGNGHVGEPVALQAVADAALATEPDPYLLERGFTPDAIALAGWRVEPLGDARRRYGLGDPAAAAARAWFIPYRHRNGHVAFERIRLVDQADIERFGGGKYRQPAGQSLALYDPFGALASDGPVDAAMVVEGEANAVTVHMLELGLPVLGLPGQGVLNAGMAELLGHLPCVYVWIDRADPGAEGNARRIAELLTAAGVDETRFISDTAEFDANETLQSFGTEKSRQLVREFVDRARPLEAPAQRALAVEPRRVVDQSWPAPLAPAAYHGLAGEIVRLVEPHSEADPAALLLQTLVAFGNAVGHGPGFGVEADHHGVNLYLVLVGDTANGRKGTSWGHVRRVFKVADPVWARDHIQGGLSSGEGLIWAVRDPTTKSVPDKEDGGHHEEVADPGVEDKRLLAIETEFASVLRQAGRDGNILSVTLRQAWDGGSLQVMTKNSAAKATDAHISLIGHLPPDELRKELGATDRRNGFANRHLFACVRRSKALPDGGSLEDDDIAPIAAHVREALRFSENIGRMRRDRAARELWHEVYEQLSEGQPGIFGGIISRAVAQIMRLACIYALLDLADVIRREHLEAALAVWRYCEQSARHVFGDALGDAIADEALGHLRAAGENGLSKTELRDRFNRHKIPELDRALALLLENRLAYWTREATAGAPLQRWFAR